MSQSCCLNLDIPRIYSHVSLLASCKSFKNLSSIILQTQLLKLKLCGPDREQRATEVAKIHSPLDTDTRAIWFVVVEHGEWTDLPMCCNWYMVSAGINIRANMVFWTAIL